MARSSLTQSLKLASNLLDEKQKLPYWQRRGFASFLRGDIANVELRLAELQNKEESVHLKDGAVNQLLSALAEGSGEVMEWAALRLSDVDFSERNWKEGLRWLMIGSRSQFTGKNDPIQDLLDPDSLQAGVFFPMPSKACAVIKRLRVLAEEDIDSIMIPAFLADTLRRTGNLADAENVLKVAERRFAVPDGTHGAPIAWELAAVKAKIRLARKLNAPRSSETETITAPPINSALDGPRPLQFLLDEYELANLANTSSHKGKFPLPFLNGDAKGLAVRWEAKATHCDE